MGAVKILHGVVVSSFACAVFFLVVIAFIEQSEFGCRVQRSDLLRLANPGVGAVALAALRHWRQPNSKQARKTVDAA